MCVFMDSSHAWYDWNVLSRVGLEVREGGGRLSAMCIAQLVFILQFGVG